MSTDLARTLWQHYRVTATNPDVLRWDAQDYRDAADLRFPHDPAMQADLWACANNMTAAALLLEFASPVGVPTITSEVRSQHCKGRPEPRGGLVGQGNPAEDATPVDGGSVPDDTGRTRLGDSRTPGATVPAVGHTAYSTRTVDVAPPTALTPTSSI